jgi:hypothetical protein
MSLHTNYFPDPDHESDISVPQASDANKMQHNMDVLMDVLENNKELMPEGDYLRGMNALGTIHRVNNKDAVNNSSRYRTQEDLFDDDYSRDLIYNLANDILGELRGIRLSDDERIVEPDEEYALIIQIMEYRPEEGRPGYGVSPIIIHHAIQFIYQRMMSDMIDELKHIRPVVCECGWRGVQANWARHTKNQRHIRWIASISTNTDASCAGVGAPDSTSVTKSDVDNLIIFLDSSPRYYDHSL